jgi:hypothetical protein
VSLSILVLLLSVLGFGLVLVKRLVVIVGVVLSRLEMAFQSGDTLAN